MSKTLDDILAEYDLMRNQRLARADRQRQRIYGECPRLFELDRQRQQLFYDQLGEILKFPGEKEGILKKTEAQARKLQTEMAELIESKRIDLSELRVHFLCEKCGDTGYVDISGEKSFCICLRKKIYTQIYGGDQVSALKGSFAEFDETIFPDKGPEGKSQRKVMRNLRNYFAAYASNYPENKIQTLLLLGEAGLGKTYLMSCLAKELQKKQEDILFISSAQLFSVFHRNRLGECSLIQPIFDAAVLFIDDLGSEPMTQNVTKESLFALIDGRLRAGLPTVIAANMDISQLKQRYQERVASRMLASDTGAVFRLAGEDIRLRSC